MRLLWNKRGVKRTMTKSFLFTIDLIGGLEQGLRFALNHREDEVRLHLSYIDQQMEEPFSKWNQGKKQGIRFVLEHNMEEGYVKLAEIQEELRARRNGN